MEAINLNIKSKALDVLNDMLKSRADSNRVKIWRMLCDIFGFINAIRLSNSSTEYNTCLRLYLNDKIDNVDSLHIDEDLKSYVKNVLDTIRKTYVHEPGYVIANIKNGDKPTPKVFMTVNSAEKKLKRLKSISIYNSIQYQIFTLSQYRDIFKNKK